MARRRSYTASQRLVSLATVGMPQPVRTVLGFRLISTLLVLLVPLLLLTGIMTIQWQNGAPHFSVNRERAQEVRKNAIETVRQHYPQTQVQPQAQAQPKPQAQPQPEAQPQVPPTLVYPPYQNPSAVYEPPPYQPPTARIPGTTRPPRY
jgi:hypothetical protein